MFSYHISPLSAQFVPKLDSFRRRQPFQGEICGSGTLGGSVSSSRAVDLWSSTGSFLTTAVDPIPLPVESPAVASVVDRWSGPGSCISRPLEISAGHLLSRLRATRISFILGRSTGHRSAPFGYSSTIR